MRKQDMKTHVRKKAVDYNRGTPQRPSITPRMALAQGPHAKAAIVSETIFHLRIC
jgi:hypothetical protein